MACRSKRENSERNPVRRLAWTIDELCASLCISRSLYEKAKREGWGPREIVLGRTGIRITDEARAEWIASREDVAAKRRERHSRHAVAEEKPAEARRDA